MYLLSEALWLASVTRGCDDQILDLVFCLESCPSGVGDDVSVAAGCSIDFSDSVLCQGSAQVGCSGNCSSLHSCSCLSASTTSFEVPSVWDRRSLRCLSLDWVYQGLWWDWPSCAPAWSWVPCSVGSVEWNSRTDAGPTLRAARSPARSNESGEFGARANWLTQSFYPPHLTRTYSHTCPWIGLEVAWPRRAAQQKQATFQSTSRSRSFHMGLRRGQTPCLWSCFWECLFPLVNFPRMLSRGRCRSCHSMSAQSGQAKSRRSTWLRSMVAAWLVSRAHGYCFGSLTSHWNYSLWRSPRVHLLRISYWLWR